MIRGPGHTENEVSEEEDERAMCVRDGDQTSHHRCDAAEENRESSHLVNDVTHRHQREECTESTEAYERAKSSVGDGEVLFEIGKTWR